MDRLGTGLCRGQSLPHLGSSARTRMVHASVCNSPQRPSSPPAHRQARNTGSKWLWEQPPAKVSRDFTSPGQENPRCVLLAAPVGIGLLTGTACSPSTDFFFFPVLFSTSLPVLFVITFLIDYSHPTPCLKVCFWGNPATAGFGWSALEAASRCTGAGVPSHSLPPISLCPLGCPTS